MATLGQCTCGEHHPDRERERGAVRTVELALHLPLDAIPYVRYSIYDLPVPSPLARSDREHCTPVSRGLTLAPQMPERPPTVCRSAVAGEMSPDSHYTHCQQQLVITDTHCLSLTYLCSCRAEAASRASLEVGVASGDTNFGRHCAALWKKYD